jgi:hypothetical protein
MDIVAYAAAVKKAKTLIDEHISDLPIATETKPGAVVVGQNLQITNSGVLSV